MPILPVHNRHTPGVAATEGGGEKQRERNRGGEREEKKQQGEKQTDRNKGRENEEGKQQGRTDGKKKRRETDGEKQRERIRWKKMWKGNKG